MSSLRELSCKSPFFSEESNSPTISLSSASSTSTETPVIINRLLSVVKIFFGCNIKNICTESKLDSPPPDTKSTRLFEHPFQTAEYYALNLLRNDHFDRFHNLSKYQILNYIRKLFKVPNDIRIKDLGYGCEVFVFRAAYQGRYAAIKMIYNKNNLRKLDQLKDQSHLCLKNVDKLNHIMKPKAYILLDKKGNVKIVESLEDQSGNLFLLGIIEDICIGNLGEIIKSWRPPTLEQRYLWCGQLFIAIKHLEDKDILHSDLKPENILVDAESNLYVNDFGSASIKSIKIVGEFFNFSSPELVYSWKIDENNSEAVADNVWQLGLCIFKILFEQSFSKSCVGKYKDIQPLIIEFDKLKLLFDIYRSKLEAFKAYLLYNRHRRISEKYIEQIEKDKPNLLENLANLLYHTNETKGDISEAHDRLSYFNRLFNIHEAPRPVEASVEEKSA